MGRGDERRLSQGDLLDDLPRERTTDPLSTVLGSLVGTFAVVSITWMVVLGFVGGTVPLTGWTLPGGFGPGLTWLAAMASVGLVVFWFVPLVLSMAVYAAMSRMAPALARAVRRPQRHNPRHPASKAA